MEALNEAEEPLNPYSRLFMLLWAIAMLIVARFQSDSKSDLLIKRNLVNTQVEVTNLPPTLPIK